MSTETRHGENTNRSTEWDELRRRHLRADRPASLASGVHHLALLCSDVERTIDFYQGILEFPLTELFENRDYQGSSVDPDKHSYLREKLEAAGIEITFDYETSIYFNGPDGERLELIADSLGEMYGSTVL